MALHASAECGWFGESAGEEQTKFIKVFTGFEFPDCRKTERVMVIDQVQAWQLGQCHTRVKERVGLSTENLN